MRIFVIDDAIAREQGPYEDIARHIPELDMSYCAHFLDMVIAMSQKGPADVMIIDCNSFEGGDHTPAVILNRMLKDFPVESLPKHILIVSLDADVVSQNVNACQSALTYAAEDGKAGADAVRIEAMSKSEINVVRNALAGDVSRREFGGAGSTTLRQLLNEMPGISIPITQDEIDTYFSALQDLSQPEIMTLYARGKMPEEKAFAQLHTHFRSFWSYSVDPHVDRKDVELFDPKYFRYASGTAVSGFAAFSQHDVDRLSAEGKKPVLITSDYDPNIVPKLLGKVSGIVMLGTKMPEHMATLFGEHNIGGLYGPTSEIVIQQDEAGAPFIQCGSKKISSGDPVTLDCVNASLIPAACEIYMLQNSTFNNYDWIYDLKDLLLHALQAKGCRLPSFKATIDSVKTKSYGSYPSGLVRTESLIAESADGMTAFAAAILRPDDETLAAFEQSQFAILRKLLDNRSTYTETRVRLVDAKPSEFFSQDDLATVQAVYGEHTMRGVQLAAQIPGFYESQVRSLCKAFAEKVEFRCFREDAEEEDIAEGHYARPIEIMVPTVRSVAEVQAVRAMTDRIAAEAGLKPNQYRFGVMMETLEAGRAIEGIVQCCDFISIGSNDYTTEALQCSRGDWEERHALTRQNGDIDPFTALVPGRVLDDLKDIVARARAAKPGLTVDLCGDHGANPLSQPALLALGLDGVSVRATFKNTVALPILAGYEVYNRQKGPVPAPVPGPQPL